MALYLECPHIRCLPKRYLFLLDIRRTALCAPVDAGPHEHDRSAWSHGGEYCGSYEGGLRYRRGIKINWAAGAAWVLTLCFCLVLNLGMGYDKFFLFIPGWFIAAVIYVIGSKMIQKNG